MSLRADYLAALETHSLDGLRAALGEGASVAEPIDGRTPVYHLIEGYLRSPNFAPCLRLLQDAGGDVGDALLEALLLDDDASLAAILDADPCAASRRLTIPAAFTSCVEVGPLHICAEFNSLRCAGALLDAGADIDLRAGIDADGFGGQTPVFHAVNSILNHCRPVMELLVDRGADLDVRLKGLVWGRGQDWETLVLDVTPLSYAQCGLYAQFHRAEADVYSNLTYLYRARHGAELPVRNVPNAYLKPRN